MKAHEAIILYLAQIYGVPISTTDAGGYKVENLVVKEALLWAESKLAGKTAKEMESFKNCIQDGFYSTTNKPFPLRIDLNQAYDLCFCGGPPEAQEKYIPLSELKPLLDMESVKEIQPEAFELLKFLREEAALILTKGKNRAYDILFKKYGIKNLMIVGKWKGEYLYDNEIPTPDTYNVDWVEVYRERQAKEAGS